MIDLPRPNSPMMRAMIPGQVCAFMCTGRQPNAQTNATSIARKIGGRFTYETVILIDKIEVEACRVLLITCHEKPKERKPAGRRKKNN
jgi:hypothetical protein